MANNDRVSLFMHNTLSAEYNSTTHLVPTQYPAPHYNSEETGQSGSIRRVQGLQLVLNLSQTFAVTIRMRPLLGIIATCGPTHGKCTTYLKAPPKL